MPLVSVTVTSPLPSLTVTLADITLVTPDEGALAGLRMLIREGVHLPSYQPFSVAWTDATPHEAARSYDAWVRRQLASATPESWTLCFAVVRDGAIVGAKSLAAVDFAVRGEVSTGSWIGLPHQSQGIGTLMRRAVLDLAFQELDADWAVSTAFADNRASCRVNEKLGYASDGFDIVVRRGRPARLNRYRLARDAWLVNTAERAGVIGHEGWRDWFLATG